MSSQTRSSGALRTLDDEVVQTIALHWEEGWNNGDVETIMAPFASNVVFSSPGISLMTGDAAKTTIEGDVALRAYLASALRQTRGVRYTLHATHVGTDSIVLVYECGLPGGQQKAGADLMRVDHENKVIEWRCHY